MGDIELYSKYFPVGKKIGVGIPLPNAEIFKDWAIIHEIVEDLVTLQLSRDVLPDGVVLQYGQIIELRGGGEANGYCCRAIIVSEGDSRLLLLRLIGEIVSDELREFYRIDAFLPIKYFVIQEQHIDKLKVQWEERRFKSKQLENNSKEVRWGIGIQSPLEASAEGTEDNKNISAEEATDAHEESWDSIIPLAANISGGGLRIITHQEFENGEYILLEILVPSSQRVVDVVGRVVFTNMNHAAGNNRECFNTGVQFVYIAEQDRDEIIKYITEIQFKRIKQLREHYLYRGAFSSDEQPKWSEKYGNRRKVKRKLLLLLFVLIIVMLVKYFWYYAYNHPKGEIQRTFEDGVKQYREQLKQGQ